MASRYWVGGTAAWDTTVGTKWALTSGGAGGQTVPTISDDVFFTSASGAGTVTVANASVAKTLTMTGFTGTIVQSGQVNVAGNAIFSSSMTYTINSASELKIIADSTISANGKILPLVNVFIGALGTTGLVSFTDTTLSISGGLGVANAQLQLNNKTISVGTQFVIGPGLSGKFVNLNSTSVTINIGFASTISDVPVRLTNAAAAGYSIDTTGLSISIANNTRAALISNVSSWSIPTLNIGNNSTITVFSAVGSFNVGTLNLGNNVEFISGLPIQVTSFNTSVANLTTMSTLSANLAFGDRPSVNCPSGNIVLRNLIIKDVDFTGGANYSAVDCFLFGTVSGISDIVYPSSIKYSSTVN